MKERLITLLTALAALGLSVFLLAPPQPPAPRVSLPTSEDRGSSGLKGLYTWLQRERVAVISLRKRYTELPRLTAPAQRGSLLIVSAPARTDITPAERQALKHWIAEGNSLLILGAVYDRPNWAESDTDFYELKKLLRDFSWSLVSDTAEPAAPERQDFASKTFKEKVAAVQAEVKAHIPAEERLSAFSRQPLLFGVEHVAAQTVPELLRKSWALSTENNDNLAFSLLKRSDGKGDAVWQIKAGEGQIFLALTPDLFSNTRLNHADNARFFVNLLGQALSKDGKLLFDDYHFGLSELYDPEAFFKDTRLHQTLGFLGVLWILYVIGYSDRLAPVRVPPVKLSMRDFIDATAGFFARRVQQRALAAELVKHLLLDIRLGRRLSDEEQTWRWLEHHPQIPAGQLALLRRAVAQRRISLTRLTNAIIHIRSVAL